MRALRSAAAPILGKSGFTGATPQKLMQKLGAGVLHRMASAPAPEIVDAEIVFTLWRHAVASAAAARRLAELEAFPNTVDPDVAAFCALLHDLPRWSTTLAEARGRSATIDGPLTWSRAWRFPDTVQVAWLAAHCNTTEADENTELVRTVIGAEALAILAGFPHANDETLELSVLDSLEASTRDQLLEDVREDVRRMTIDAGLAEGALEGCGDSGCKTPHATKSTPAFAEGIVKLQELSGSERYRPVLTSLVAGACRYLGADRAFFTQWVGKRQTLLIRTKYDRSAEPIGNRTVRPSAFEAALMGKAAGSEEPALLRREENFRCELLDHLGCDACLVVPVLGGGACHGLLLLDWNFTMQADESRELATQALALAGVCGQTMHALHLKRLSRRSAKEAQIDALTGLLNRRAALDQLEREIQRQKRNERPMAVMMLDLDHFKSTNDNYGHLTGDRVLASVGRVLKETLRSSDVAGRYGGEEFVVVQVDTTIEEATIGAARIYKAVEEAGKELEVPITISIGLTELRSDDTVESLLRRADQALYASKHRGRNRFSIDSL